MPELPEVEVTRRFLAPLVEGRRIRGIVHSDPARYLDTEAAKGLRVIEAGRRGKFLRFRLEEDRELIVHLGMSGGFRLRPTRHTRVVWEVGDRVLYFHDPRRFGRWWVIAEGDERRIPLLAQMGPEPLDPGFSAALLRARLERRRGPIKAVLLDQTVIAGLGNIYADESLFAAGIRPDRPANTLELAEVEALVAAIRRVLAEALEAGGSTLGDGAYRLPDARPGYFQHAHMVYARADEPCRRCETPIVRIKIGGRSTHFCPVCQR